ASQYIVAGVLTALYAREVTGRGQFVDTSQMQAAAAISGARAVEYFSGGPVPGPMGSGVANVVPSRAFRASDGRYVNVSATDDVTWLRLCGALGLDAPGGDAVLASPSGRVANRARVETAIEEVIATATADHWVSHLSARGVPAGLYFTHNNLRVSEQVRAQRMLEDVVTPWGRVTVGGVPWHFSRTPGSMRTSRVPGADSAEILELFAHQPRPHPPSPPPPRGRLRDCASSTSHRGTSDMRA
ncbi:MAG: CoA transferase, partial [Chloroflexi bacterium]|nr:CoA transferase [Chloroflexota bacterium]